MLVGHVALLLSVVSLKMAEIVRKLSGVPALTGTLPACGASGTARAFCFPAAELLEALHDHVAIQRVQLHQVCFASVLLGGDQSRATSSEQVQDVFAGLGRIFHSTGGQR